MEQRVKLVIADNGIGISAEQLNYTSKSLGLKLLKDLTEDIQGEFNINGKKGTAITIEFEIAPFGAGIIS